MVNNPPPPPPGLRPNILGAGWLWEGGSTLLFGVRLVEIIFIINSEIQLDLFFWCVTCGIPAIGRRSNVDFWYAAQGFFSIN